MRTTGPDTRRATGGFSLLELLMAVTLVLLLAGAMVFNFSNLMRGNQLEEGTTRLETLMRYARAQAANSGRKVQIVFSSDSTNAPATPASTGEVRATWEPDPLRQPGCYTDLEQNQWHVQEINDLVQVESVTLLDANAAKPPAEECDDATGQPAGAAPVMKPVSPITFYPDGSSDSAEIIVAARSPEEDQRMSVRLVGVTGSISHQLVSADLDDADTDARALERLAPSRRDSTVRDSATERDSTPRPGRVRTPVGSAHTLSPAPRSTIGETNSLDRAE
jgi:Tfp pilus assembly protein FimT